MVLGKLRSGSLRVPVDVNRLSLDKGKCKRNGGHGADPWGCPSAKIRPGLPRHGWASSWGVGSVIIEGDPRVGGGEGGGGSSCGAGSAGGRLRARINLPCHS